MSVELEALKSVNSKRLAFLILGMHRSGTSVLTRLLNILGCDVPATLLGANASNESGHWESERIVQFNERLLASAGTRWDDWLPFNASWYNSPVATSFADEAANLIDQEFGDSRLFVFKDPRICRVAPFWQKVMATREIESRFVLVIRNPLDVAASLQARDGIAPALGHLLWLRHALDAEAYTRGQARSCITFESIMKGWQSSIAVLADRLDVSLPRMSLAAEDDIDSFIAPHLRHHLTEPSVLLKNPLLADNLKQVYTILCRWSNVQEKSADYQSLDVFRAELNNAGPVFGRLVSLGRHEQELARELQQNLSIIQDELHTVHSEHDLANKRLKAEAEIHEQLCAEQARLHAELSACDRAHASSVADMELEIERVRSEVIKAEQTERRLNDLLEQRDASIYDQEHRLAQTNSALAQQRAENDDISKELVTAQQDLEASNREIEQLCAEQARLHAELSACDRAHASSVADMELEIERVRSEVIKAEQTERRLNDLLEQRDASIYDQEHRLAQTNSALAQQRAENYDISKELVTAQQDLEASNREIEQLKLGLRNTEARAGNYAQELATLSKILEQQELLTKRHLRDAQWLRDVASMVLHENWIMRMLPRRWRRRRLMNRLQRRQLFDGPAYLARNPDVGRAGDNPLRHYITHGMDEGR